MINTNTKIEDIVKLDNAIMDFFNKEKIDFCCNGHMTIEEVAGEKNISPQDLLEKIEKNMDANNFREKEGLDLEKFKDLSLKEMVASLIVDHHNKERDLLFEIDPLLNKILSVHYNHHGKELMKLHSLFADLKKELEEHFVKEEEVTFPLMLKNENPSPEIIKKVEDLEVDHEKAGSIIKEMIDLTSWFKVPEDGCNTYEYTFNLLEKLVKDVFVHIFKENSIMFEKYIESEEK
ncbi:DUF542 domain-containing protein [Peptoniphilus sp. KCTC 25270]|uniref:DUF542 domain-containing protein n=1 Tax=Peptoniphilus sp. KCTC 25270 TaxID=2897414 RepID=UPI001E4106B3|nr:DUF542 domain-containing protein [Peptoniphilus sp. KCTC 25270]MCD1146538.1 DUF542 domain-containing protein [Peptoniphilus sp. KCTC 25270]